MAKIQPDGKSKIFSVILSKVLVPVTARIMSADSQSKACVTPTTKCPSVNSISARIRSTIAVCSATSGMRSQDPGDSALVRIRTNFALPVNLLTPSNLSQKTSKCSNSITNRCSRSLSLRKNINLCLSLTKFLWP